MASAPGLRGSGTRRILEAEPGPERCLRYHRRIPVIIGLLAAAPLAAQGVRVSRLGAAKNFGPGIVEASPGRLRFELQKEAYVIALQLDAAGGITPVFPTDTMPSMNFPGAHFLTTSLEDTTESDEPVTQRRVQSAQELARTGRSVRPPAVAMEDRPPVGYWLLIVSDAPTTVTQLRAQLETMNLEFRSVEDELRALPKALVGSRAKTWGAYYASVY